MDVNERSSFKRYLATYSVSNKTNISAFAGLDLIKQFIPKLKSMLNLHKGIKFYFDVQCHMVKYLDGEVLTEDKDRWVGSTLVSVNDISDLDTKLKSSKGVLKQKIINQEAHNGSMWVFKKVVKIDLHLSSRAYLSQFVLAHIRVPSFLALTFPVEASMLLSLERHSRAFLRNR